MYFLAVNHIITVIYAKTFSNQLSDTKINSLHYITYNINKQTANIYTLYLLAVNNNWPVSESSTGLDLRHFFSIHFAAKLLLYFLCLFLAVS